MAARVFYDTVNDIVAIRTVFPENGPTAYGAMTTDRGGHYETAENVEGNANWVELEVPSGEES